MPALHRPHQTRDRFFAAFGDRPATTAEALGIGLTRSALRAAVRRGLLEIPRRGVLTAPDPQAERVGAPGAPTWEARHVAAIHAAIRSVGPRALVSHDSAAVVHGLARPSTAEPGVVSLIVPGGVSFDGPGIRVRGSGVPERDRTIECGLRVTSLARTAVDLARGRRLPAALVPLDAAARRLIAASTGCRGNSLRHAVRSPDHRHRSRAELDLALAPCFGWPGTVAVRSALLHAHPAAESPLESRSRGWFVEAGIGDLDPGAPIACGATTYWADFCDRGRRIIGEADGWAKYGDSSQDMRAVLERERERQRRLEADGWTVVRWSSSESRGTVITRMSRALSRT